ncbi:exodeoxyribonuclease III [Gloeocapsa sp. PCC 73106]|uniref:exodeoxyribonuclease III n=1 Tax=Gloeocapsa sp. PCC 73106 TaxID=102232 RepID=UPI0002ABCDF9|nr:exodeoxyribonuclease III [Gloeocapsa sp. PCC 73106]ELR99371.1 exodeoxyribonuclease III [Gloeocapsa sp. PCC 73106]
MPKETSLKIATWNVNSIRTRQQLVREWLVTNQIEILCLQETKVVDGNFPRADFEELGYQVYVYGQKAYNGVAIFSKIPLKDVSVGFSPILGSTRVGDWDEQKRLITGVVNNTRIVNVYVPNGAGLNDSKYEYKLKWLGLLREYLQTLVKESSLDICICGDFNIAPEDKDIYNSEGKENHIMFSPPERQALQYVLDIGFQDALRKFNPNSGVFTWWDYRANGFSRNRGWRIDHHYLSPNLYEKAESCWVDLEPRKQVKPSDHTPVIVSLEF